MCAHLLFHLVNKFAFTNIQEGVPAKMILNTQSQFESCLSLNDQQQYIASYDGLTLTSVFQPIYDTQQSIVGLEALVRIFDSNQQPIRPDLFFGSTEVSDNDKVNVERLSRVIHMRNFARSALRNKILFLNVLPIAAEKLAMGDIKSGLLVRRVEELKLTHSQIVLELIELDTQNPEVLNRVMHQFKQHGFKIAIDDFGVNASTIERVKDITPNIIKFDRSMLLEHCDGITEPLKFAIDLAKSIGAKTVIEGVETEKQLQAIQHLDIDMYQGFYFAMPKPLSVDVAYIN